MPEHHADYLPPDYVHPELQELEKHNLFRHLVELTPDVLFIYAPGSGRFLYISPGITSILGYIPDELLHLPEADVVAFVHPDDMPRMAERYEKMRQAAPGEISEMDYRLRNKNGEWVWLSSRERVLTRAADGMPTQIVGLVSSMEAQKQMEARNSEAEERLRLLTDNARDYAMIFLDDEARVTHWNIGAERILGWTEEEAVGQPGQIIFTPEDRAAGVPERELGNAQREGRASDERWHVRKDGSRFFWIRRDDRFIQ